ncbi:MAG: lysylphosphatidylglycerol synthase transmembrane domain-containing protein [Chloroflexota bacterium]
MSDYPIQSIQTALQKLQLQRLALLLIFALCTYAILLFMSGSQEVLKTVRDANWTFIAFAMLIHYSGFAVRGHRWQLLLTMLGHSRRYVYVTALLICGWFISALIPARAGDAVRVGLLRNTNQGDRDNINPVPIADSVGSILLERLLDLGAILMIGAVVGFGILRGAFPTWVFVTYVVSVTMLGVAGLGVLMTPFFLNNIKRFCLWLVTHKSVQNRRPIFAEKAIVILDKLFAFIQEMVLAVRQLAVRPVYALILLAESLYIWLCDALVLWLVVRSLSSATQPDLPLDAITFVAMTVDLLAAIPITPGGIGQIETAYAAVLQFLALPMINISATILLIRGIAYWSFLLFSGMVTLFFSMKQFRVLAEEKLKK